MRKNINKFTLFLVIMLAASAPGCLCCREKNVINQVSTITALMNGSFLGSVECGMLADKGDTGLGTFDGLDGELIELDGTIYKASIDGKVYPAKTDETVPFAVNTFFRPDKSFSVTNTQGLSDLKKIIDSNLLSLNYIYAFKVQGKFSHIKVRSVPKFSPPYPTLADAVKLQKVFEYRNMRGTIVGFRFPAYMEGVNVAGYHMHFISADKKAGGHLLDCAITNGNAEIARAVSFKMDLPRSGHVWEESTQTSTSPSLEKIE